MIENVLKNENLQQAYRRVYANKGASGVDGKMVNDLLPDLQKHQKAYIQGIREGNYQPAPILGIEIPKSNGKTRLLGVPTVVDRVFQQAIQQVLQPIFEQDFQAHSYGFRPKRNAHQAMRQSLTNINQGYQYIVDIDLESFFDNVGLPILDWT
ncbi:reverse transcriptase domain-containing protein [Aestuariivivens insulae]|uniref:reverse transcriptase domain-containing protein n=1 Tax=Aestuariivivens insulae TaxID=1621988 RepID=UPI001F592A6C|nr:reverse transcriptase domain-containing protein [Aestuariivivens insulae]